MPWWRTLQERTYLPSGVVLLVSIVTDIICVWFSTVKISLLLKQIYRVLAHNGPVLGQNRKGRGLQPPKLPPWSAPAPFCIDNSRWQSIKLASHHWLTCLILSSNLLCKICNSFVYFSKANFLYSYYELNKFVFFSIKEFQESNL